MKGMKKLILLHVALLYCLATFSQVKNDNEANFQSEGSLTESIWSGYLLHGEGLNRTVRLGVMNDSFTRGEIEIDNNNTPSSNIYFKTTNANGGAIPRMTIKDNGRVGIGTTNPSSYLDVVGNAEINGSVNSLRSETTGQPVFYYSQNSANGQYMLRYTEQATGSIPSDFWHFRLGGAAGAKGAIWGTTDNSHLTLLTSGNLGVGTSNPSEKLDIEGNADFGTGANSLKVKQGDLVYEGTEKPYLFHDGGANRKIGLGITDDSGVRNYIELFEGNVPSSQYIDFGINGSSAMKINSQGEVAIGTSDFSNDHKLRVEGSIGAREIKVEASGWSDFVFEKGYELRTLEEVEEHINENGHLPEIPSEEEVSENGINLGEMDAKLLQKIEELTLYMIDMNKQMKTQATEIEQLKTENSKLKNEVSTLKNE